MRQAHTPSGRLCIGIEDIVSANGDIGLTRVERPMGGTLMALDSVRMGEVTFAQ